MLSKGRVERAIRYVRDNFFAGRQITSVDALNIDADAWCRGPAADRRCPEQPSRSVREVLAEEAAKLLKLPGNPFPILWRQEVMAGKTPYVRFDLNDYSIPHTHVRRPLTVLADHDQVRVADGGQVIAIHPRSYDKGEQVETPAHIETLVEHKRAARHHRANDRLFQAAPASQTLLQQAAERGSSLGTITAALIRLLERYGAAELRTAIADALDSGTPHPNAVRLALERHRDQRNQPPPVAVDLPEHVRARDVIVQTHALESYDQLKGTQDEPS